MFGALFITQTVDAVDAALAASDRAGAVGVFGLPRLAHALAARGRRVVVFAPRPRSLRRVAGDRVYASAAALPVAEGALSAWVAVGEVEGDGVARVVEWSRAVRDGGLVILVDRAPAVELSRRALCGGLAEIEQREAGRTVVTSGVVVKL
jgi:hypothetical protein